MNARPEPEVTEIIEEVRSCLRATGKPLHVPEGGYRIDDEWLYVVVCPEGKGLRAYDYVQALGQIEKELKDKGHDNVLLVPALDD